MMRPIHSGFNSFRFCWAVTVAILFMVVKGYSFNGGDQEEHLPYVYRLLNPELYPVDYLVPFQISHFTVRFYYAHLIAGLSHWLPVSQVVLLLQFVCLTAFAHATGSLAARIARSEAAFVLAPFLALIVFNGWTTGGNSIMDNQLTCTVVAMAAGAYAVNKAFSRNYSEMAFFSGLAALFQVLSGLQLFLILFITVAGINRGSFRLKKACFTLMVFFITASPMLVPIVFRQFFSSQTYDHKLYYFILFEFRNAHHYLPSAFPVVDYVKTLLITGLAILIFLLGFFTDFRRFYWWFSGTILAGLLFYFVGFQLFEFDSLGKLQWFKSTAWLTWAGCITFAAYLSSLRISFKAEQFLFRYGTSLPLVIAGAGIVFMNSGSVISPKVPFRYQFSDRPITSLQKMHAWIRENTPVESSFIIPPDDDRFLCEAQRSVPVAWKGIIHEPWFLLPWYSDFQSVYGTIPAGGDVPGKAALLYGLRPDSLINPYRQADYRLLDIEKPCLPVADSSIIHQENNFILLRFHP